MRQPMMRASVGVSSMFIACRLLVKKHRAGAQAEIRLVGEESVHSGPQIGQQLRLEISVSARGSSASQIGGQECVLRPKSPRVHLKSAGMRISDQRGRLTELTEISRRSCCPIC